MSFVQPRRHGSVTDRLAARMVQLEAVVDQLAKNEAYHHAQIETLNGAAKEAFDSRAHLITLIGTAHQELEKQADDQRDRYESLSMALAAAFRSINDFRGRSFWQRLRWFVMGR